ncbi:glycosyltransferase [Bifidobacterium choloepi]|uniref:Glycosyltransferase n=1 Tax=Bifidobacterium choloepi TaxID=2614131 RepID=A0A6I5N974_9BIFI|nr:glycosyltransferase [Bifidobacterium choloepi]NEG70361.1 glycosyltransferase [Bifidobacterium choloepi]
MASQPQIDDHLKSLIERPLMPSNPRLSVIVPVYRIRDDYLATCLDSLISQTLYRENAMEIIVVIDGTPNPRTIEICKRYEKSAVETDGALCVIQQPNQGVSVARNTGMTRARGQWIAFVDADDWCEATMFETLVRQGEIGAPTPDVIVCNALIEDEDQVIVNHFFPIPDCPTSSGQPTFCWDETTKLHALLQLFGKNKFHNPEVMNIGVPWAKLYNADFLRRNSLTFLPELLRMQDNIFNLYAFHYAERVTYFPEALYHFRRFQPGKRGEYSENFAGHLEKVLVASTHFLAETISTRTPDEQATLQHALKIKTVQGIRLCLELDMFHPDNPDSFVAQKKKLRSLVAREPYSTSLRSLKITASPASTLAFAAMLRLGMFRVLKFLVRSRS